MENVTGNARGRVWSWPSAQEKQERNEAIARLRAEGKSMDAIAAEVGCSRGTVYNTLRDLRAQVAGYRPARELNAIFEDRHGVIWRFADDAFIAGQGPWLEMVAENQPAIKFEDLVAFRGWPGTDGKPYLRVQIND